MQSSRTLLALLLLLPPALLAQSDPSGPSAPPPTTPAPESAPDEAARELENKRVELARITEEIDAIQTRAETAEEVKAFRDSYRDVLQAEMERAAPGLKADIQRQAQLVSELKATKAEGEGASPEKEAREQKLVEYRVLHQKLAPVEEGVRGIPAVQDSRKQYYDKLIAEMQRIEPKTQELLAKHRELVAVVRELSVQAQPG